MRRRRIELAVGLLSGLLAMAALCASADSASTSPKRLSASLPSLERSAQAYQYYKSAIKALAQGELDAAIESAQEGLDTLPNWVELRNLMADCLVLSGRKDEAIVEYRISLVFEPANIHAEQALIDLGYSRRKVSKTAPFERLLAELINKERINRGLSQLILHPTLSEVARVHSVEMRDRHYFSHISPTPDRRTMLDRFLARFAAPPAKLAENIARRTESGWALSEQSIRQSHEELMKSPGHRANILDPKFTHVGIGIAIDDRGNYWITEMFMRMK